MSLHSTDIAIVGAGPAGLFCVFQAGLLGLKCHVVDVLPQAGGQCQELYPDKPIFDIPAVPECSGADLVHRLLEQAGRFAPVMHLGEQAVTLEALPGGRWLLGTDAHTRIEAGAIVIAGGVGSFTPRRLSIPGADRYENRQLFYAVRDAERFRGQRVAVLGGGDSALDWARALVDIASHVTLVHRREQFKAAPDAVQQVKALAQQGALTLTIASADSLEGSETTLQGLRTRDAQGRLSMLPCDAVLAFFGLTNKLGPLAQWGLERDEDKLRVAPSSMAASRTGVFVIGDMASYAGKLNLILAGFHEAAIASHAAYAHIRGDRPKFQYSTHSDTFQRDTPAGDSTSLSVAEAIETIEAAPQADAAPAATAASNLHINVRTLDGSMHRLAAKPGQTLLEIIGDGALPIKGSCYGCCNCSTCHVYVDEPWMTRLAPMIEQEQEALDMVTQPRIGSRLACQIEFSPALNGLALALSEDTIPD